MSSDVDTEVVQDETTPIHSLMLSFAGIVIMMVIGPFLLYHCYLVTYVPSVLLYHKRTECSPIN